MLSRLRGSLFDLERRVSAVGSSFVDMFLRDNKVIPVVLALLALLVFAFGNFTIFPAAFAFTKSSTRSR